MMTTLVNGDDWFETSTMRQPSQTLPPWKLPFEPSAAWTKGSVLNDTSLLSGAKPAEQRGMSSTAFATGVNDNKVSSRSYHEEGPKDMILTVSLKSSAWTAKSPTNPP